VTPQHGSRSTYINYGCRCDPCTKANSAACREWAHRQMARRELIDGRLVAPLPDAQHGKQPTYTNHGCRCEPCTAANRDAQNHHRKAREARP